MVSWPSFDMTKHPNAPFTKRLNASELSISTMANVVWLARGKSVLWMWKNLQVVVLCSEEHTLTLSRRISWTLKLERLLIISLFAWEKSSQTFSRRSFSPRLGVTKNAKKKQQFLNKFAAAVWQWEWFYKILEIWRKIIICQYAFCKLHNKKKSKNKSPFVLSSPNLLAIDWGTKLLSPTCEQPQDGKYQLFMTQEVWKFLSQVLLTC